MSEAAGSAVNKPRFHRVMLKLSGQALAPAQGTGIDLDTLAAFAREIKEIAALDVQLAMVIGAAISCAAANTRRAGWTARVPTRWACWAP